MEDLDPVERRISGTVAPAPTFRRQQLQQARESDLTLAGDPKRSSDRSPDMSLNVVALDHSDEMSSSRSINLCIDTKEKGKNKEEEEGGKERPH